MLPFLKKHWKFFLLTTLVATALRLWFVLRWPVLQGDTLIYADIAKHWLNEGIFGLTDGGAVRATLIRLPGYPAFIAAIFAIFGEDHFRAVMLVQLLFDLGTCFIIAATCLRIFPESRNDRGPRIAFLLAAVCPFTANYVGTPLTETLSIFFSAASLLLAVVALDTQKLRPWILCGLSTACAILLRPDGGLLLGAIGLYLLWRLLRAQRASGIQRPANLVAAGLVLTVVSLAPLVPWTIRNWRTFHVFQPLVTFAATDPGEFHPAGWERWLRTWMIDYVTMEDLAFHVSGESIEMRFVPPRAFDSDTERERVAGLFDAYNADTFMSPELDAQFADIARARIHAHPVRYFLLMPAARLAAMWLRPRTEMLPLDSYWWRFADDPHDATIAMALGLLNLLLVGTALAGIARAFRSDATLRYAGLLVTFVIVRSLFMMYAGVAEQRYLLECYPIVFISAAYAFAGTRLRTPQAGATTSVI